LGLTSFVAEQRKKEIGVRKVLGASVLNVWNLLSKDFVVLVTISFLAAFPLSYYFMHSWLQNYSYRTQLSWWIFPGSRHRRIADNHFSGKSAGNKSSSSKPG
jgi:ABC-type antimicrobial peptide transport system permease subunit